MGISFSGMASGLDTTSIVTDLMEIEYTKVENLEKEETLVEWEQEIWEEMNDTLYSFYKEELFDFKSSGTYTQKTLSSSDESTLTVSSADSDVYGSFSIDVTNVAKSAFITGDELEGVTGSTTARDLYDPDDTNAWADDDVVTTITVVVDGDETADIDILAGDDMSAIAEKFEDLDIGLKVDFDDNFNRFFISTEDTGTDATVSLTASGGSSDLETLGFMSDNQSAQGENAVFEYNGTTLESSTNDISVNGLSFDIYGEGSSTITVNQDTDAIYEEVKTFINKYNEILAEMNELVGADYLDDEYEPLTDDEKDAMTDDEIEAWEETIKEGLLRNDDTMESLISTMRNTMYYGTGVDMTDFTYTSLTQLGITTGSDYDEQGLLHIHGDSDDSEYSLETNVLEEALEDDPEAVKELLTALGTQLYENFQDAMSSTSMSSALTFYNDKYLDDQIEDIEDDIDDMEDYIDDVEERYYEQFTAMELSIQESNSTGEWLAQQLASM